MNMGLLLRFVYICTPKIQFGENGVFQIIAEMTADFRPQ
jgi:hypothetical protein